MNLPPELSAFFSFIATPIFASWLFSEFFENWEFFQKQDGQGQQIIVILAYVGLGCLSFLLVRWVPPTVVEQLQPFYAIVIGSIAAFASGQLYHAKIHADNAKG